MSKKPISKKIRDIIFGVLSFVLSLFLFVNSICIVLYAFVFNKNAWIDQMNSSNYFVDKTDEIKNKLVMLGNASGLPPEFFDNVVDTIQVSNDTQTYFDAYFNDQNSGIDTTAFKQKFYSELDSFVKEKDAKVDDANVDYLVKNAENIYSKSLQLPLFYRLSVYFTALKKIIPFIIAGLGVLSAVIVAVLFFANKWRHRAFKYIYYATSGVCLSLLAISVYLTAVGGLKKIVLDSRALYNFAVLFGTNLTVAAWAFTAFFFIISFAMYFIYRTKIRKISSTD